MLLSLSNEWVLSFSSNELLNLWERIAFCALDYVLLSQELLCVVTGAGFLGMPVWWQHGSETRNRFQDDSSTAEHSGAVGCLAW